jgi:hypothetical protein
VGRRTLTKRYERRPAFNDDQACPFKREIPVAPGDKGKQTDFLTCPYAAHPEADGR